MGSVKCAMDATFGDSSNESTGKILNFMIFPNVICESIPGISYVLNINDC